MACMVFMSMNYSEHTDDTEPSSCEVLGGKKSIVIFLKVL